MSENHPPLCLPTLGIARSENLIEQRLTQEPSVLSSGSGSSAETSARDSDAGRAPAQTAQSPRLSSLRGDEIARAKYPSHPDAAPTYKGVDFSCRRVWSPQHKPLQSAREPKTFPVRKGNNYMPTNGNSKRRLFPVQISQQRFRVCSSKGADTLRGACAVRSSLMGIYWH